VLKRIYVLVIIFLYPLAANALTFNEMLVRHPSKSQPFMGEQKNVKWVSHTSDGSEEAFTGPDAEADKFIFRLSVCSLGYIHDQEEI